MNNIFREGMTIKNRIDSYFNCDLIKDIIMTRNPIINRQAITFIINYEEHGIKSDKIINLHLYPETTVDEIVEECINCIKTKYNIKPKEVLKEQKEPLQLTDIEKEILEEIERLKDKINKYFIEKRS